MNVVRGMSAIVLVALTLVIGCSPKSSDLLVLEVGPTQVTLGEYENFYTRNSGGWDAARKSTQEEREHFLDLLTNYKLKLQDAADRNIITDPEILRELREYRASLATTYIIDKEITSPGIRQLYDRRKEEIRAQHVILRASPTSTPEETLKAYTKALEIIRKAKAGVSFDSLALQYSEDPTAKQNAGDLYYFTGGQMVSAFENAAYGMKKGEISAEPVRSPFGYHIIKITDRKPVAGSIKASHIMARFQQNSDSADDAGALARIKGLQDSLKKGWEFHALAGKLSEDAGSATSNGDLGWFERRRFVLPFDEAAFALKAGQTSGIVRTPFGYHIIHCDSVRPLPPYSAMVDELKKTYQQHRYQEDYADYVEGLKTRFRYRLDDQAFGAFASALDSTKTTDDSAWASKVPAELRATAMMTVNGRPIPVDTVITILEKRQDLRPSPLRKSELATRVGKIGESFLIEAGSVGLEERNKEFGDLMKEYTDGIVLYKVEQTEVWNKTTVSDTALRSYYEQNIAKFMLPEQVSISVLTFESDTLAYLIYDSLKAGANFNALVATHREDPNGKSKDGARGLQPVTTDDLTREAASLEVGGISEPIELDNGMTAVVKLFAREPARPKSFEEAGAEVSNAYQDAMSKKLEQQWLENIRLRYPVKQHKEALKDAFSSPPAK